MDRRQFLQGVGTFAVADVALSLLPEQVFMHDLLLRRAAATGLNMLQGLTTETTTQLTVDVPKLLNVEYILKDRETGKIFKPDWIKESANAKSPSRVDKMLFTQLELGHNYQFTVKDTTKNVLLDERFLTTMDLSRTNAKIAVMSCIKDSESARTKMWISAQKSNADYYFMIGDTVYGDSFFSHGPDKLWSRFIETRMNISYYQWKNLKPVLAVWDDHDYGKNNEDGEYEHKDGTLKVFKAFYGQEAMDSVLVPGPANSMYFRGFNQNFLFLDSRYYRKLPNGRIEGFLGAEQMKWISDTMVGAQGPTWIMEGSPFFGRADKSNTSYESIAKEELNLFLGEVSSWNSPSVFMGGDVHYSEISQIDKTVLGYQTYEFISSCMHSSTKSSYYENPNKHMQGTFSENFLTLEKTGMATDPTWKVSSLGADSKVLFTGDYKVG
ncbi:MAG: alkaline phosphatase D family protein [Bdellovibrionales bacterium]